MRSVPGFTSFVLALAMTIPAWSASKPHVVFLGKSQTVKIFVTREESQSATLSVRPLYVDSKLKDYTTGDIHDVTERQFVVQRAFRMNDSLPGDSPKQSKWIWQRGDWLLVDRVSGHIVQIKLPDFDPTNSHVSWYRDYAAYCGTSESGSRSTAIVAQIGVHKTLFRKELGRTTSETETSATTCSPAKWERRPARVTFSPEKNQPFTVNVVPHHAEEFAGETEGEQ